jgi:beta-glucosidase-like glycosyl hydrolase
MRTEGSDKAEVRRAKAPADVTTMRVRRTTLAKLAARQRELGAASLDEALETILFRQRAYEAIARLKSDPEALAAYRHEAEGWAEVDVEVHG